MLSIREKVAQTAVGLIDGKENIKDNIGGIFIGAQIITEVENNIQLVRDIVTKYRTKSKVPLLIVSDFENGCGSMVKGLTPLPYLMGLGAANSDELAYNYGKATAIEALSVGANWTFSPVADLNINPANPLVNVRGISDSAAIAIPLLKNIIKGMQENGLAVCAKHFPGDGVDCRDQHIVTTYNTLELEEWKKSSGKVFQELINSGVYSIMAGHIGLPAYQKEKFNKSFYLPATLSSELITNLLKKEMGFKGVVISDALNMGGFLGWYNKKEEAEIECFKAGCDMLLWPTPRYIDNMVNAVENGYVSMERLNDAVDRIMGMKDKIGLFNHRGRFREISSDDSAYILNTQRVVAEKSVTLIRDVKSILPVKADVSKNILLIPVTHYAPALKEAGTLKTELEKRGLNVNYQKNGLPENEIEAMADKADLIIYALFTRSFRPIGPVDFFADEAMKIANSLKTNVEKTIVVSFGSPYFGKQYFERANVYINAYSMLEPSVKAFTKALFGEIPFGNFSPVKL